MSSLRNAVKRITHKERGQPQSRARLGLLQKKKDYKKRAIDYQTKQERLQAMKLRASMKNPDEFYMGMHNAQVKDGTHRKTEEARRKEMEDIIGPDAVKMMKNQDLAYVRYQQQKDAKKIEHLQSSLHFLEDTESQTLGKKRKHVIFLDNKEQAKNFDVAQHFDTLPELAGRSFNRPKVETLVHHALKDSPAVQNEDNEDYDSENEKSKTRNKTITGKQRKAQKRHERRQLEKIAKAQAAAYAELEARNNRQKLMANAEAHLVTEKLVAGKGRKRKVTEAENGKPAVYKWRRRRAS